VFLDSLFLLTARAARIFFCPGLAILIGPLPGDEFGLCFYLECRTKSEFENPRAWAMRYQPKKRRRYE